MWDKECSPELAQLCLSKRKGDNSDDDDDDDDDDNDLGKGLSVFFYLVFYSSLFLVPFSLPHMLLF